ncbi:DUF87 domain-containing protein [Methanoplanus sp. FWC-SCC4]|uniref:DUF87 domain-containing protein n=1 Tax=Methanochimaera problematica TaxID=2609417 RepID=A0AA97I210_9EURY|nr:DUF87 domain-containing protein [Methanoplanus sp. FWC-SCC4]WOF15750.1 DUF87 domain-containing protein [Methanoplanus sp. FWC-SCC4]
MQLKIGKAGGRDFSVDAQELVTGRTCIIAQSGSGKSWSIAVLCEKMCRNNIGFCLIDTEGEYYSLKEKFENIWWVGAEGGDSECEDIAMDYDIEKVNIRHLMERAVAESRPVIYDVSEVDMVPRVTKLAHAIYDVATDQRKPYLLIVEEADKFIPQSRDSIKKIEEISRRGRKRGLGLMVATQRPAIVTKNVLSQCNSQIIGKLSIENDLKAVGLFFSSKQEVEELTTLNPGDFFVMGSLVHEKTKMRFGNRETKHRGVTPLLEEREMIADPDISGEEDNKEAESEVLPDKENPFKSENSGEKAAVSEKSKPKSKTPVKKATKKKKMSLPVDDRKKSEEGVIPLIEREEALEIASGKLRKKRFGFGTEERLLSGDLIYKPLVCVSVRYIGGLFRKTTRDAKFLVDGINGHGVEINGGLCFKPLFSEYLNLDEPSLMILKNMSFKGCTSAQIEAEIKLEKSDVEKSLKLLEERKLITESETVGESDEPVYVPLTVHPFPSIKNKYPSFSFRKGPFKEKYEKKIIDESDIRMILKVSESTSEIVDFSTVYYPVYKIVMASGPEERTIYIDAVEGKEVAFVF